MFKEIMLKEIIVFILLPFLSVFAQGEYITVTGDSLVGRLVNGETIREVYGNVVLTQGNVVITCNKAIQFISRNDAELIGSVVVKQDSLTITTPQGFYYGDERRAESHSGVKLDDRKVILTAISGEYFFNEDRAFFRDNVQLYDTTTTLTSDSLTYFQKENRAVAVSNVKIVDPQNVIEADSLQHFRETRITFADNNVKITGRENNVVIYGGHLEDYAQKFYSIINEDPILIQIDTTYADSVRPDSPGSVIDTVRYTVLDTLIIKSNLMEAYRDTINMFEAKDSVKILRGIFASRNDYTIYYRNENKIITNKVNAEADQPVLWYEYSQLTGDSVTIHLRENRIELLELDRNAFILSQNPYFNTRYDQISGERIKLNFDENGLHSTEVEQNVYSIYYLYEEDTPNGLIKATSEAAVITVENKRVASVKLNRSAKSEYYPENMVLNNELSYTLPGFKIIPGRPVKEELLKQASSTSETFLYKPLLNN
jgi:lipopolysaccharide export system protein LptA